MIYFAIIILILFSAFFSSMETAFSSVNKIRLKKFASDGDKRAVTALKIADSYDKTLTGILIGNNIVNILSASLGTIIFTSLFGESGVGISTAVMTVLVLIFGEILPKTYAKGNAEKLALNFGRFLNIILIILYPLEWFFIIIKNSSAKLYTKKDNSPSVTEDELKYIIEEIEDQGVLEEQESNLVKSALEFDEIEVDQILVPRVKIVVVEKNEDLTSIKDKFLQQRYTRMPVYEKTIDNIVGIIHEKDFFDLLMRDEKPLSIDNIIQKPIYILETKHISDALKEMQKSKMHMAIVKDQYGGTSGIVTLEDIIEELVGEIYDENDEEESSVTKVSENEFIVSGEVKINDLLDYLDMDFSTIDTDSKTVGGWVMELFGDIPKQNEVFDNDQFTIKVLSMTAQHVAKIKLTVKPQEKNNE